MSDDQQQQVATMLGARTRKSAVILAGAAGKGPYAAGALTAIARDPRFDIRCVVGASSGALNAAVFAGGLRVGRAAAADAADKLCHLWCTRGAWYRILCFESRVALVQDALELLRDQKREHGREVTLQVVVASLPGEQDKKYKHLRFERTYTFETAAFEDTEQIRRIAEVSVASSAIPGLFSPRKIAGEGPFWDGGIVNNTPIGHALKSDLGIDHLIVVTPDSNQAVPGRYWRLSVNRLLEMAIEERLARDLSEAKSFNEELEKLRLHGIDTDTLFDVLRWRMLQFVEIRPDEDLAGNLLSGFFSRKKREHYVERGKETAKTVLGGWSETVFASASMGRGNMRPAERKLADGSKTQALTSK
jgi:NTE family protein